MVVYDSSYGNTRKIAETIAGTLAESGVTADLLNVHEVKGRVAMIAASSWSARQLDSAR